MLGDRATRPLRTVRDYALPPWPAPDALVLCSSYSGDTEETLACFEAAGAVGAPRVALTTGGQLAELARAEEVPVIGVPAGMQPRAAVVYMTVAALECARAVRRRAAAAHRARRRRARCSSALVERWGPTPGRLAGQGLARALAGHAAGGPRRRTDRRRSRGAGRRSSTRTPKAAAFASELPEADHNEICGWERGAQSAPFAAVFLEDSDQHPRLRRRIELTAAEVERAGGTALRSSPRARRALERVLSLVLLGDLVSVYLAVLDGRRSRPIAGDRAPEGRASDEP